MEQFASLREVNQHLSRYIEVVEQGGEVVITRRGKPIARIVAAASERRLTEEQQTARRRALERMRAGFPLGGARIDRDEIYDG
jgi:prevent-host-death family protein